MYTSTGEMCCSIVYTFFKLANRVHILCTFFYQNTCICQKKLVPLQCV